MKNTDRNLKKTVLKDYFDRGMDKNSIAEHYLVGTDTIDFWIKEYENENKLSKRRKNLNASTIYQSEADNEFHLFLKKEPILLDMPHYHESIEIILFLKGSATAHIGDTTYKVSEGEICCVDKFQNHFYNAQSRDLQVLCLVMGHGFTHHYRHHFKNLTPPPVMRDKKTNEKIITIVQHWLDNKEKTFLYNCAQANLVLDAISRSYELNDSSKKPSDVIALQFIDYIENNYRSNISLSTMAKQFGYSKVYVSKLFNKSVGQHFNAFLNAVRIQKAVEMINSKDRGEKTVTSIIYECGFDNPVTFYRNYKKNKNKSLHGE